MTTANVWHFDHADVAIVPGADVLVDVDGVVRITGTIAIHHAEPDTDPLIAEPEAKDVHPIG